MAFKKTNNLIYLGLVIHLLITLIVAGMEDEILLIIMTIPLAGNLVGLYLLSFTNKIKLGAKIFMISSIFFIPIGIVGITGARKELDTLTENEFFKNKNHDKRV